MPFDPIGPKQAEVPLATAVSLNQSRVRRTRVGLVFPILYALLVAQGFVFSTSVASLGTLSASSVAWIATQAIGIAAVVVLIWKVWLVGRYRSVASLQDDQLPSVAVIVPAYNEGSQVYDTLMSLAASDYPRSRIEIIAVDDGSDDDTWVWMERAQDVLGDRVALIHGAANRGKKHALYEGFARTRAEVIVTVDSDSEVLADTLRNLVSPLVVDRRIGAVAGNVRVLNEHGGALARMLDLSFTYAFEFMRASESQVGCVQCCPGALTALRRSVVDVVKREWIAQSFFGQPASIGEDRALTNLVLREGHRVTFQSNAVVLTDVPERLPQLCKMLLRWERSNVRESLVMAGFIFGRFRPGPKLGARVNFVWSTLGMVMGPLALVALLAAAVSAPWVVLAALVGAGVSALLPASIYAAMREPRGAWWALPWAALSATALAWITPWAVLSCHRGGWLTRQLALPRR